MKKLLSLSMVAAMLLAGCGSSTPSSSSPTASGTASAGTAPASSAAVSIGGDYIMGTGGTSGTYYPLGGAMCQVINRAIGTNITANSTGASIENVRLINKGEIDLALVQSDTLAYAMSGTVLFEKVTDGFGAVFSIYPEVLHLVVRDDSDIKSITDLKGKKVSVGDIGSGAESNAKQILAEYGITYDDLKVNYLSYKESATAFQDGSIDAFFLTTGIPNTAVTEVGITTKIRLISVEPEMRKKIIEKYPFLAEANIPAEAYNLAQGSEGIAVKATLIASNSLSEEVVYQMTKAVFENLDDFGAAHANAKMLTLDSALEGIDPAHLHPGAVKYYKEIGAL